MTILAAQFVITQNLKRFIDIRTNYIAYNEGNLGYKNKRKGERKMEKLGNQVVESTLEAASVQTCTIKKALPIALPLVVVAGLGLIVVRFVKNRKAKKAAEAAVTEEVNPEV